MATGRIGVTPVLGTRWSKEPAGGTTSLSGLDDNSVSLVYSVGYEQVYRNGVLLSRGNDYTATNGTSITLTDATITGDIIEVFAQELVPLTDAISKGQFTAKGSLLSASAASTPAVLAVGTNGQVLKADSSTTTGLAWGADASGKVLQVIGASTTSSTTITSTSLTDTGITATITPSSATSKILVMIAIHRKANRGTAAVITGHSLLRGATEILGWGNNSGFGMEAVGSSSVQIIDQAPIIYLDSPATTSATTYKVQARVETAGETLVYQFGGKPSTVVLMEIGA